MLSGLALGLAFALVAAAFRLRVVARAARRNADLAARLARDLEMVVRFMQEMVDALNARVDRRELCQLIARGGVRCADAQSACVYERTPDGRLRGVAVEGLFPPQRAISAAPADGSRTRAQVIEQILRSETLEPGEGVVGSVAASRKAELIVRPRADMRIVDHRDPAIEVRSLIVAPMEFNGALLGVLAVANPVGAGAFTGAEFSLVKSIAGQAALALRMNELQR